MKEINSSANKNYKLCIQLAMRKYRDKFGLYLIEGSKAIFEAMQCNAEVVAIFLRAGYETNLEVSFEYASFSQDVYVLNDILFKNISQTETSQGIIAIVKKKTYTEENFAEACKTGNMLVLDRLQDPGNIGTMIRTADAAGYQGIICLKGTGDVFSPKVVRAAAGSIFRMPILFIETEKDLLVFVKSLGKRVVSTCFDAKIDYFDVDLKSEVALLIGNEGSGLSSELIDGSDIKVKIPMKETVDSLNAAVAAGILMYESKRA
jgi:TrmH family RNA methyltransferase